MTVSNRAASAHIKRTSAPKMFMDIVCNVGEDEGDDGERDWDDARESKSRNMRSRGWGDARG